MAEYEITVYMPVEVTFTIDDAKLSDWDGRSLMRVHENGERWADGPIDRDVALALMAAQIIDRGRLAGTDGWADFPDGATPYASWPHFFTDDAEVHVRSSDDTETEEGNE